MRAEAAEAPGVILNHLSRNLSRQDILGPLDTPRAIYSVARGSSDAAATVFNYAAMERLGLPATTLPPSVFSIGTGVAMQDALVFAISQSGASADLVAATRGAAQGGARVVAVTNVDGSEIEAAAHHRIPILAGPERAVPATKSVAGAIAAGVTLIAALDPDYAETQAVFAANTGPDDFGHIETDVPLAQRITEAQHIYVIGRQQMYGAAQEIALKIKECCAIHAEAYSATEVLHGPLQLSSTRLLTLILDSGDSRLQSGLDTAQARFTAAGSQVLRLRSGLSRRGNAAACGAILAAELLTGLYPEICSAALMLGHDPDSPNLLNKVTQTT
ncbi:SIS domain-containing protein [Rhodobacteraceae bacterium F11138]|nr:SIS domain-containing protein [Rhodobacteraceae bacterium F11138]